MTSSIIPGVLTVHVSENRVSQRLSMLTALQTVKRQFHQSFRAPFSHISGDNYFGNFFLSVTSTTWLHLQVEQLAVWLL